MKKACELLKSKDKFLIKLGLERISSVMELLDNPQEKYKIIHIAGTNGKGSTSKMINDALIESGCKVGLFTSPHIFNYEERIKVNNVDISSYIFDNLINKIDELALKNNIELTEFELICAAAFYYFYIKQTDYVVLEVGLGGLFDATNIIKSPSICAITTIDLEHTERLGNTIEEIATQKGGIIKTNCPVVICEDNFGFSTISQIAKEKKAPLLKAEICPYKINLKGAHQKKNASLAYSVLKYLGLDEKIIEKAFSKVAWPYRMQYIEDKNILIDSAHNPSGIKALRDYLDDNFKNAKKIFIFGCLKNKDYDKMLEILLREDDELYFNEFNYPNALKFDEVDKKYNPKRFNSIDEVIAQSGLKIFCGSIYMLGEVFKKSNL